MTDRSATDPYVFISYASADHARVLPLVDALERGGHMVWLDKAGIPGGVSYGPEIARAIRESSALLLFCSESSFASRNVRQEVQLAWKHDRPILPLILDQTPIPEELEYWLEGAQWIEILNRGGSWLPDLAKALGRLGVEAKPTHLPAPSTDTAPTSATLPNPLTSLIGRAEDLMVIVNHLGTHRLVTLTGPGGIGKTRLGIESARVVAPTFNEGVVFVDLAPLRDSNLVLSAIASALGLREGGDSSLHTALASAIGDGHLLLVLDNVEHLLEAVPAISALLATCGRLTVLATSRSPLGIRGEQVVSLNPLTVPDIPADTPLADVRAVPAVSLFLARAREVQQAFDVDESNVGTIIDICQRLDGLPLAIELAAARVKMLTPDELRSKLTLRLPLLTGGARDLPDRQRTLRNTIAWSHDLLSEDEQRLFRQLSVFVGGWSISAAEQVCALDGDPDILDCMSSLVDRSLVRMETNASPERRFGMMETIREFGLDCLANSGEVSDTRARLADWCLSFAKEGKVELTGPNQVSWIARLDAEAGNIRAMLDWTETSGQRDMALELVGAVGGYWFWRGRFTEGRAWTERALAASPDATSDAALSAMYWLGLITHHVGAYDQVADIGASLLSRATERGRLRYVAGAHHLLSYVAHAADDNPLALLHAEQAVAAGRPSQDWELLGHALSRLGTELLNSGELDRAEAIHREALAIVQARGDLFLTAVELNDLADVAIHRGDLLQAVALYRESGSTYNLHGAPWSLDKALNGIAEIAGRSGEYRSGARLLGAADALRRRVGMKIYGRSAERYPETVESLRVHLGAEQFEAAWQEGRALSPSAAATEAMATADRITASGPPSGLDSHPGR